MNQKSRLAHFSSLFWSISLSLSLVSTYCSISLLFILFSQCALNLDILAAGWSKSDQHTVVHIPLDEKKNSAFTTTALLTDNGSPLLFWSHQVVKAIVC